MMNEAMAGCVADLTMACVGEMYEDECELSIDARDIQHVPTLIDPSDELPF